MLGLRSGKPGWQLRMAKLLGKKLLLVRVSMKKKKGGGEGGGVDGGVTRDRQFFIFGRTDVALPG